jgi:hypothetical protein
MIMVSVGLVLISSSIAAANMAPEIGVMGVKCWTKDQQLKHPYGVAAHLLQPISRKVTLVFEYEYLTSKNRRANTWNSQLNAWERNTERNRVSIFQFGFLHGIAGRRSTFLEVGGGLCVAYLSTNRRIVSTYWGEYSVDATKVGLVLDVSLLVTELKDLPLVMRFGFRHRFLSESRRWCYDCGGSAFLNAITTTEVSWGLGYQLDR